MPQHRLIVLLGCLLTGSLLGCTSSPQPARPNVVYILADDLGYGDLSCYNPGSKIATPHIDRLAAEGMRFTDAHSPSAVCTPTRYGLLTGRYCWRSRLPRGVLHGYSPTLIQKDRHTVADLFRRHGYTTACIGKWHLGLNWSTRSGLRPGESQASPLSPDLHPDSIDFEAGITGGPPEAGFDYSFILPASLDMEPYCYLENNRLLSLPLAYTPGNDLNTGYTGAFWRPGKMAPDFDFEQVMPTFIQKAIHFIGQQASANKPFFLYLPLASPHTPWVPTPPFQNTSGAGQYGDFVQMVDAYVGKVLATLDSLELAENTLLIFTSDNGPFWRPEMAEQYQHRAAYMLRGMKADIYEGGHRVPFMVRWPGKVPAGMQYSGLTSLTDFMASAAALLGDSLAANEGEDSFNMLPAWLGQDPEGNLRDHLICQSSRGYFAIRKGPWKYVPALGSGGFSPPWHIEPEPGGPQGQLYKLDTDIGETQNLYLQHPQQVTTLSRLLNELQQQGRSSK